MKQKLLKTFSFMSNFLFWLWVWIGTPLWIFIAFFVYDPDFLMESIQTITRGALMYIAIFVTLFYLRKFAKKLLETKSQ